MKTLTKSLSRKAKKAISQAFQTWAPPRNIRISDWADDELHLSEEDSNEAGKYRIDRAPYQRGILDAFQEEAEEVVVMTSSQIGKTLMLKAIIGFFIAEDGCPILVVQPTVEMAETFSKDRLAPMIRDTPALRGRVRSAKSRDASNTILKKNFKGGHVTLVGANAPAGLASRPIRIVLLDEVDRYPISAGTEGDPVNLARKRTITFGARRRIGMFSTPGIKGESRIEQAWLRSDQRRYFVPCPQCGHMHVLSWENVDDKDGAPKAARMICPEAGCIITDADKPDMLARGEWRKTNPSSAIPGFHLNELYSPWRTFGDVVADYQAARGNPEQEKTWINTSLGETYEASTERADADKLAERRENYDAETVPAGVLCVTAGIDNQKDRLEVELVGWGVGEESWGLEHIVLHGLTTDKAVWKELDELLAKVRFRTVDGRTLRVLAACADTGGCSTQQAYEFCTPRGARNIWGIKGLPGARPVWPKKVTQSKKHRGHIVRGIGVDTAKDVVYARWLSGPDKTGYCHFPMSYTDDWFAQAVVEKRVIKVNKRTGAEVREWHVPKGVRNEAFDCRVYAYCALQGLKIERRLVLVKRKLAADDDPTPTDPPLNRPPPAPSPAKAPPPSGASALKQRRRTATPSRLRRR